MRRPHRAWLTLDEVARAVVDQRCGRCHSLDRVYKTAETPEEWRATVNRMVAFAEGSSNAFQPGEDEQIITYLSATQTSDAVNRRRAHAAAASSAGRSLVTKRAPAVPDQPAPPSRYAARIGFISFVFLSMLTLAVRRPSRGPLGNARSVTPAGTAQAPVISVPVVTSLSGGPLILKLASITPQASDAKTLAY